MQSIKVPVKSDYLPNTHSALTRMCSKALHSSDPTYAIIPLETMKSLASQSICSTIPFLGSVFIFPLDKEWICKPFRKNYHFELCEI
ncbi:hypothetical protein GcC1_140010 [Golovinomyces cichoracearum]|uniref:Uncharacterized protein n=1 Tax=Golovinomyces cichoracearum TaxID=62708 RepID=A0A420I0U7_9PEZI|nr:hypothetical protein GcC1_140010 [Golovinomyces cichoracearum]